MGVKIKEAKLINELTDSCLFPISDGSEEPKVANFVKVKEFLGDTKQVEININSLQKKINYLTRNDKDSSMSVREISENVLSPIATNVQTIIGTDTNKSMRTIATEVLAGASTGGEIDLDLYLSKSEAERTYATKESLETTNDSIDDIVTRVDNAETNIRDNSNLLSGHSQQLRTLQTEQESQKATIQQQGTTILTLDLEVDGVKGDVSEAMDAIGAIETELEDKADKSVVDSLSKDLDSTKEVIETKVGKGDLKSLTYKVNGVSQTFNGLSEATIPQIFTPTQVGSQGQLLQSMGGGAPQWTNLTELPNPQPLTIQINNLPKQTYKGDTETNLTIFAPTKIGKNNQVVKCRDGVMADWDYVKWNDIEDKPDVINFAKDLTGVIEATPEEFIFRPSAGDKSIRDESAVIRRIKGNTSVWGQLADISASFTNSGNRYIITRNDDGSVTIKRNPSITSGYWCSYNMNTEYRYTLHKYMFYANVTISGITSSADYCGVSVYNLASTTGNHSNYQTDGRHIFCCFGTPDSSTKWQFAFYVYGEAELTIHNLQCFDLTNLFGAGNEPTTLEEFKKIYPDIYPYCEPEIRNMRVQGIETISANAFNKDDVVNGSLSASGTIISYDTKYWVAKIEVVPGKRYSLHNIATIRYNYALYDSNNKFLSADGIKDTTTNLATTVDIDIPIDARYMSVVVHNDYLDSCCVNLSHSGTFDIRDAIYFKKVIEFPDIVNYFPIGMNGIGNVYDEINSENAVTRVDRVDLGTLDWEESSVKGVYGANISDGKEQKKANIITHKYPYRGDILGVSETSLEDKSLFNYYNATNLQNVLRIYIKDTTYSDVDAFKEAMQGVYLYYELAEPTVKPILETLQLDYEVADFGTEKALTAPKSSPFRADIVYQFNAEGRIRDNGRNIEKLEAKVNTIDRVASTLNNLFDFDEDALEVYVVADGLLSSGDNYYYLPSSRRDNTLMYNLASEQFVIDTIPTEIATATQKMQPAVSIGLNLLPNIVYEFPTALSQLEIVSFENPSGDYDHVWTIRFAGSTSFRLVMNKETTVYWKDGTAPTFGNYIYELAFRRFGNTGYIGECKKYG